MAKKKTPMSAANDALTEEIEKAAAKVGPEGLVRVAIQKYRWETLTVGQLSQLGEELNTLESQGCEIFQILPYPGPFAMVVYRRPVCASQSVTDSVTVSPYGGPGVRVSETETDSGS